MIRMQPVFWTIAALDGIALLVLLISIMRGQEGRNDGGHEMALFFYVIVPSVVLVVTVLLYAFVDRAFVRWVALFVVAVPGLWFVKTQIDDRLIDRRIASHASGAGFFLGDAMQDLGRAVIQRDIDALRRIGPSVDVNQAGEKGMTLLKLAVDGPYGMPSREPVVSPERDDAAVVRALLALGAKPDQALASACRREDTTVLRLLLEGGGNPNLTVDDQPLVFSWLPVLPPDGLRLLADHGLDLNTAWHREPLAVYATIYERWDLLTVLVERGADIDRPRDDGRNVRAELARQMAEALEGGKPIPAALAHVAAMLHVTPQLPATP